MYQISFKINGFSSYYEGGNSLVKAIKEIKEIANENLTGYYCDAEIFVYNRSEKRFVYHAKSISGRWVKI